VHSGLLGICFAATAAAACCPPPDPEEPSSLPPPPKTTTARTIPPSIVGRFERPDLAPPKPRAKPPDREMLKEPPLVPPTRPKTEIVNRRETLGPTETPVERASRLPDDVVMSLLETGRAAFLRCFKKAVAADPTVVSFKVRVRVELDADGSITQTSADTTDSALAACLTRATGWIRFPASGKRVVVELPLFYRGE
jgi:hypothetical protein